MKIILSVLALLFCSYCTAQSSNPCQDAIVGKELAYVSTFLGSNTNGRAFFYSDLTFQVYQDFNVIASGNYSVGSSESGDWCYLQEYMDGSVNVCNTFSICNGIITGCEAGSTQCYTTCSTPIEWKSWFTARPLRSIPFK